MYITKKIKEAIYGDLEGVKVAKKAITRKEVQLNLTTMAAIRT